MQKVLNQEEIDALFQRARGGKASSGKKQARHVVPCDFRSAGQITKDQLRLLTGLHETFARNLTHSLGAYLRIALEMAVVSVEQLTYKEFIGRMPEMTYFGGIRVNELDAMAGLTLELPIAYPILDLLLGGRGRGGHEIRELTEIEQEILGSVVATMVKELSQCWNGMGLSFSFEGRHAMDEAAELISPTERVLAISFEIRLPEVQAMLNIVFSSAVAVRMQRALQKGGRRHHSTAATEHIRSRMMESLFPLELLMPPVKVAARDLLELESGGVLTLHHKINQPVALTVAGSSLFTAFPVASHDRRAAYVQKLTPIHNEENGANNGFE
jgi:flagellar motor switch protein FliM